MRRQSIITTLATALLSLTTCTPTIASPPLHALGGSSPLNTNISIRLFAELEELSRIVDISYCVGTTGISKPFSCVSRCNEFPSFELVDTFNTGPLMSDSCGYIVLDHGNGRVIVAFRGTYSIANTIVDLSTVPQEYAPYPGNPDNGSNADAPTLPLKDGARRRHRVWEWFRRPGFLRSKGMDEERRRLNCDGKPTSKGNKEKEEVKCENCTVHSGFWTSWQNTRPFILPHISILREKYPNYKLNLVGHSLGGAVAALAGLEFDTLGWNPIVTTFGEPKVGNTGLRTFIDRSFELPFGNCTSANERCEMYSGRYRRITHVDDPVPLLPLQEWGYRSHAGEVFISKGSLQPSVSDLRLCYGDEDPDCIAGAEVDESWFGGAFAHVVVEDDLQVDMGENQEEEMRNLQKRWGIPIPSRYKMWQLFFAHRDYFWRLGLCVSGGDPTDWGRDKYDFGDADGNGEEARQEL